MLDLLSMTDNNIVSGSRTKCGYYIPRPKSGMRLHEIIPLAHIFVGVSVCTAYANSIETFLWVLGPIKIQTVVFNY